MSTEAGATAWVATIQGLGEAPDATLGRDAFAATLAVDTASATVALPAEARPRGLPHITLDAEVGGAADAADLVVRGVLGEGGMGRVVLALQRSLGREVAIKTVRPDRVSEVAADAILHEARVTGALEHPNVIPVHALGRDDGGAPVMVMKRVEGVPWRDLLRDPDHAAWGHGRADRLGWSLEILGRVCDALAFAHARRVVHRDVKPENVMVGAYGEVYLVDWGIAVDLAAGPASSHVVGTPSYLAPEMLEGSARLSPRTDVFLLGATLHEVLTGRPRHEGVTVREALEAARAVAPFDYGSAVPAELAAIANRATARDPAARFEDAQAFGAALADFARHRGSLALADEGTRRLADLRAARADDPRRARAMAAECRFAFRHALEVWDDNRAARDGLEACLVELCEIEIEAESHDAAKALFAELAAPRPDLEARLAELARRLEARAAAKGELARLAHEGDVAVSHRQRTAAAVALLALGVGLTVSSSGGAAASVDARALVTFAIGTVVVGAVALALGRRALLRTRINRQIVALTAIALLAQLGHRAGALALGTRPPAIVTADLWLLAAITGCGAALLRPAAALGAVVLVGGAIASAAVPERAVDVYGVATVVALALMIVAWRPSHAEARPARGSIAP